MFYGTMPSFVTKYKKDILVGGGEGGGEHATKNYATIDLELTDPLKRTK